MLCRLWQIQRPGLVIHHAVFNHIIHKCSQVLGSLHSQPLCSEPEKKLNRIGVKPTEVDSSSLSNKIHSYYDWSYLDESVKHSIAAILHHSCSTTSDDIQAQITAHLRPHLLSVLVSSLKWDQILLDLWNRHSPAAYQDRSDQISDCTRAESCTLLRLTLYLSFSISNIASLGQGFRKSLFRHSSN